MTTGHGAAAGAPPADRRQGPILTAGEQGLFKPGSKTERLVEAPEKPLPNRWLSYGNFDFTECFCKRRLPESPARVGHPHRVELGNADRGRRALAGCADHASAHPTARPAPVHCYRPGASSRSRVACLRSSLPDAARIGDGARRLQFAEQTDRAVARQLTGYRGAPVRTGVDLHEPSAVDQETHPCAGQLGDGRRDAAGVAAGAAPRCKRPSRL